MDKENIVFFAFLSSNRCLTWGPWLVAGAVIPAQGGDSSESLSCWRQALVSAAEGSICEANCFSREKDSMLIQIFNIALGWWGVRAIKTLTPSLGEFHSKMWKISWSTISMKFLIKIVWRGLSTAALKHLFQVFLNHPSLLIYMLKSFMSCIKIRLLLHPQCSCPSQPPDHQGLG